MNAISYSLFGYGKQFENCYDFKSYLRYLTLIIRMNRLLYPGWETILSIDDATYISEYKPIFDYLNETGMLRLNNHKETPELCKAMLWRLEPIFQGYDRVICRDIDSIEMYKGRAAVQVWDKSDKICHVITDSVSHNIVMMGGLVGFKLHTFKDRCGAVYFDELMLKGKEIDFNAKGADQTFLNKKMLPGFADSLCEHYFLGMPQSFRSMCFVGQHIVDDVIVDGIPSELKESNHLVNHIGQAGFNMDAAIVFFKKFGIFECEMSDIEKQFPNIYYWQA